MGLHTGQELRDPSRKELAGYYSRLVRWYTQGGFTDELGVRHESGYHYKIPYWEVFNEIDVEHQPTPEQYTKSYDAIVGELHAIDPAMKFVGLALAFPERNPEMMEYYLDHRNHKPGIPLDLKPQWTCLRQGARMRLVWTPLVYFTA